MNCPRCGGALHDGQALQSTLVAGMPDFPGQTDLRGQTLTYGGPGRMVDVLKCGSCGYSRTKTLKDAELQVRRTAPP